MWIMQMIHVKCQAFVFMKNNKKSMLSATVLNITVKSIQACC